MYLLDTSQAPSSFLSPSIYSQWDSYLVDKCLGASGKRRAINLLHSGQGLILVATTHAHEDLVSYIVDVAGFETIQQADK